MSSVLVRPFNLTIDITRGYADTIQHWLEFCGMQLVPEIEMLEAVKQTVLL